jgi:hypothetical protein
MKDLRKKSQTLKTEFEKLKDQNQNSRQNETFTQGARI